MVDSILLSSSVLNTISALPDNERKAVLNAFVCDEIFRVERDIKLSPLQEILYAVIKDYIKRDTHKYHQSMKS